MLAIIKRNKILITCVVLVLIVGAIFIVNKVTTGMSLHTPGTKFLIASNLYSNNAYMTDNGTYAIYIQYGSGATRLVHKYNLTTDTDTVISSNDAEADFPEQDCVYANNNYVCWLDFKNYTFSEQTEDKSDVYTYSFSSDTETRITTQPEQRTMLTLEGNYIAYSERNSANPGIYIKDLSNSNSPTRIHTFTEDQCINLDMGTYNGNTYVVFEDHNNGGCDIKTYNINTSTTTTIASSSYVEYYPAIQNGNIYYTVTNTSSDGSAYKNKVMTAAGSINRFNMSNSTTSTVMSFTTDEDAFVVNNRDLSSNVIIKKSSWSDNNTTESHLYKYNPVTDVLSEFDTTDNTLTSLKSKSCDGDELVFTKWNSGNESLDVYHYDLSNAATTNITNESGMQFNARIIEDSVIWIKCLKIPDEDDVIQLYGYFLN